MKPPVSDGTATSSTKPTRPTWDDVRIAQARLIALRSLCERDKVGAIIVSKAQRVVAEGYNGPPAGFGHGGVGCSGWCSRAAHTMSGMSEVEGFPGLSPEYFDCPSLHAEANALMVCDRKDREGGMIYVTSGVCFGCAKLIANSGLTLVVVDIVAYEQNHRDTERSYRFLESCGITVVAG